MIRLVQLALFALLASCGVTDPTAEIRVVQDTRIVGNLLLTFRAVRNTDDVEVFADVQNVGTTTGQLEHGPCSFAVRGKGAFGDMWDHAVAPGANCPEVGLILIVDPGVTLSRRVYLASVPILRQQVPPGPYDITVFIRLDGKIQGFFAGQIGL